MSPMNPSDHLTTIRTAAPGDPAIDWSQPGCMERVIEHRRRRTRVTLDAVPTKPGASLTLYTLRPLTRAEYRYLSRLEPESYAQLEAAAEVAVVQVSEGPVLQEIPARAIVQGPSGAAAVTAATEEGSEILYARLGPTGLRELGALAIARCDLGDAGPFGLPPGTAPARSPQ